MNDAWSKIRGAVERFISRPTPQPPFNGYIEMTGKDFHAGKSFVAEASYFSVQMIEMRLAEGGKYFTTFLPMGVFVAEYTHGMERRRIPLVLSNETAKQIAGEAASQVGRFYFTNMPIVRRTPMKQDNLALFVGLFRMPFSDVAKSVLQLAADVSQEIGGATVGPAARVASKLYDRVAGIFDLDSVQARFAYLNGAALTKSGYFLVSGPLPDGLKGEDLVVTNGNLKYRSDPSRELPRDLDYCLLAIDQTDSIFSPNGTSEGRSRLSALAGLSFHQKWREVSALLARKQLKEADEALLILRAEVIVSPELTEEDRLVAIGGYDVAYAQYKQALLVDRQGSGPETRGSRSVTPATAIKTIAAARKASGDFPMSSAMDAVAIRLQSRAIETNFEFNDERLQDLLNDAVLGLCEPLAIARNKGVTAAAFADALAEGTSARYGN